jgi:hypothetical protein
MGARELTVYNFICKIQVLVLRISNREQFADGRGLSPD